MVRQLATTARGGHWWVVGGRGEAVRVLGRGLRERERGKNWIFFMLKMYI